jgi:hypothetical protein
VCGATAWAKSETKEKLQMSQNATVTIEQAIKTATEKVPGKVIEAELEKKHDKPVWGSGNRDGGQQDHGSACGLHVRHGHRC